MWQKINASARAAVTLTALLALAVALRSQALCEEVSEPSLHSRVENIAQFELEQQLDLLSQLREIGPEAAFATQPLLEVWRTADGATDDKLLAGCLDVFRAMGSAGASAGEVLSQYLPHESNVYCDRDQLEVIRLRSYLMVTLGDVGLPATSYPYLLDSLAHFDERMVAIEIGSAAYALRSAGHRANKFIPHLLRIIPNESGEEEFTLTRYAVDFPSEEATTAQLEAIRTLAVLCHREDARAVDLLKHLSQVPDRSRWDRRVKTEAAKALKSIYDNPS